MTLARRLLLVMLATAAVVVGGLSGAGAHSGGFTGGITGPSDGAVLTETRPTISGSFSHSADPITGSGTVDQVSVIMRSLKGYGSWTAPTFQGNGGSTLNFTWQAPSLAYNGPYEAQAQAQGRHQLDAAQQTSGISVRRFSLAVPPAAPTGLTSSVVRAKQQVNLTWNRNPEPDTLGYDVQRQASGASTWKSIGQVTTTSSTDVVPDPGTWKYRVIAVRAGATDTEGVTSEPSALTTATVEPPPTTTSTTASRTGGGSGGSGDSGTGGSGSDQGGDAGSGGSSASGGSAGTNAAIARAGRVDLSGFASLLDANRRLLQTAPTTEYDPGYDESLPFKPLDQDEMGTDTAAGGQSVELGYTRTRVTDDAAQRRKMAYFAGSLLAFVLAMHGWFLRSEIRRQEELEAIDLAAEAEAAALAATLAVSVEAQEGARGGRRAARRVSPRPGDHRSEGGAAVRARRRRPLSSD